jgi:hypothetical protein
MSLSDFIDQLAEAGFWPAETDQLDEARIDPYLRRRNLYAFAVNDEDLVVRVVDNGEEGIDVIVSTRNGVINAEARFDQSPYGVKMAVASAIAAL